MHQITQQLSPDAAYRFRPGFGDRATLGLFVTPLYKYSPAALARLVDEVPDLAAAITGRFGANLHHMLATIRPDGSPRLSGSLLDRTHLVADTVLVTVAHHGLDATESGPDSRCCGRHRPVDAAVIADLHELIPAITQLNS